MSVRAQDNKSKNKPAKTPKFCHKCGRDITRTARYRDEKGYWCAPCSKADKAATRDSHLPCDDCGRQIERTQAIPFDDLLLCSVCSQQRYTEALRAQLQAQAEHEAQERLRKQQRRRRIIGWSIVAVEAIIVFVLTYPFHRPRPPLPSGPSVGASTRPGPATAQSQAVEEQTADPADDARNAPATRP